MSEIISEIRNELLKNADDARQKSGERFFKEEVKMFGVKTALVSLIGKEYFKKLKDQPKEVIFELCEKLWKTGFMEESFIACNWSHYLRKNYQTNDFSVFEKWVNSYISNWASCDTFCNHTIGDFVQEYPEYLSKLKEWAKSPNRWVKRASAVSLIVPARKGKFLPDIFEIADILLQDKDDMVQKGYGWMLKAASQANQEAVFNYVVKNKHLMPRTALRYAIEKMPGELKRIAMEK